MQLHTDRLFKSILQVVYSKLQLHLDKILLNLYVRRKKTDNYFTSEFFLSLTEIFLQMQFDGH